MTPTCFHVLAQRDECSVREKISSLCHHSVIEWICIEHLHGARARVPAMNKCQIGLCGTQSLEQRTQGETGGHKSQ